MKTSDFDYTLPPDRIAQTPIEPRHAARLLVLDRKENRLRHTTFWHIDEFLSPGDLLVINQTRVIPARLHAHKETGGRVEVLLLHPVDELTWEALIGGKRVGPGVRLQIDDGPAALVISAQSGPRRHIRFQQPIEPYLERVGEMPLPPYIHTRLENPERYQTVYASIPGSAAAPTAGLHFTPELINRLEGKGVQFARVTLHVGLDTFAPVTEEEIHSHPIHTEWCQVSQQTAQQINATAGAGGKIVAVGTTTVRTLETAALHAEEGARVGAFQGATNLFITPGYLFRAVDFMVTNFHLPRSTLIMLVSAFAGRERVLSAYQEAIEMKYRFYSFGDAMLIL